MMKSRGMGAVDPRKMAAPKKSDKTSVKISRRVPAEVPADVMNVGPARTARLADIPGMKCGGGVQRKAKGGAVTRGDGCATKGHTRGKLV
jgi:hypothetical protein